MSVASAETRWVWAGLGAALCAAGCASGANLVAEGTAGAPTTTLTAPTSSATTSSMNQVGGEACPHTGDHFSFYVEGYATHGFGCGAATGKLTRSAVVTGVDSTSVELSTCPPGAPASAGGTPQTPCLETLRLFVSAPDFTIPLILGAYVHVEATVTQIGESCAQSLEVTNLPSFGGLANPTYPGHFLLFSGADGTLTSSADALAQVKEAPGCGPASRPGFVDQQLSFSLPGASPVTVVLPMGTLHVLTAPDGTEWSLRDLRSFRPDGAPSTDLNDFAYVVRYVPPNEQ